MWDGLVILPPIPHTRDMKEAAAALIPLSVVGVYLDHMAGSPLLNTVLTYLSQNGF